MWKVWALRAGCSEVDQSMLTYLDRPGLQVIIPHVILLLQGSVNVLVDTSFGSPAEISAAYPQRLWRDDADQPQRILGDLGLIPGDIDLVIHTHLHYDHVGNDHLFESATKLAQRRELAYSEDPTVPVMAREYFTERHGFPAQFDRLAVSAVDGDCTVMPGLEVLLLPGHTPGSQGLLIETGQGALCYPGDLVMVSENMHGATPVGLHTNLEECEQSREKVAELGARVIPSHDMRLFTSGVIQQLHA